MNNDYVPINFEEYTPRRGRQPGDAKIISVGTQVLHISFAAYVELGSPDRVVLVADPTKRIFGIRPATDSDANSLAVQQHSQSASRRLHYSVSAKAYLTWAKITDLVGQRFVALTHGPMLIWGPGVQDEFVPGTVESA